MRIHCKCEIRECKNFLGVILEDPKAEETGQIYYCLAFPNGIPNEIAYGNNFHTDPYSGDNGIQFEPKEK